MAPPKATTVNPYLRSTRHASVCVVATPFSRGRNAKFYQKALKERGIDQMVEDARADNKENDSEYMKPTKCEFSVFQHCSSSDEKQEPIDHERFRRHSNGAGISTHFAPSLLYLRKVLSCTSAMALLVVTHHKARTKKVVPLRTR